MKLLGKEINEDLLITVFDEQINGDKNLVFPLNEEILCKAFSTIDESDDPKYNIEYPKELLMLTNENINSIIRKSDILNIFPELIDFDIPKIYIMKFDFDDIEECKNNFLKISNELNKQSVKILKRAISMKESRGLFIDFTIFGIELGMILLNERNMNDRTIYHEWTHLFQRYVGLDKFFLILEEQLNVNKKKEKKLEKFNLNKDTVDIYFFSKKEYITRFDNLIYMIHQTQKLEKYKNMKDFEFIDLFIKTFSTDNKSCLDSEFAKDILSIDNNFMIDLKFFISAYICFKHEYMKICNTLQWRI